MQRSELKMTGQTYRLTPDGWGENSIMVDEEAVAAITAVAFGQPCNPDADPNDRPEVVDIATRGGKFFALLKASTNLYRYRECENPADARDGSAALYGRWEHFDEDEEERG